jgi:uncharacterized delta-60 repeat protein
MKKNFTLLAKMFILSAFLTLPLASMAQDGSLDFSFGDDGIVTTSVLSNNDYGKSLAIQIDNKIVVAGSALVGADLDFALIRYNSDGSLDTSFSSNGIVLTPIGNVSQDDIAYAVAIQNDGKIIAAGGSGDGPFSNFALVRYNTNGSLDTTFDADGMVTTGFVGSGYDVGYSLVIQNDGKILLAGSCESTVYYDLALARYNNNGSLDTTFGIDGKVITAITENDDNGYSVALQNDGKILVAGNTDNGSDFDLLVVRYNTNGSLDSTFDSDGIVTTSIGLFDDGKTLAIQDDGKIVVGGSSGDFDNKDIALVRYNTNGSLDNTFDFDGIVTTAIGPSDDIATSIAIQNDGKITLGGYGGLAFNTDFALVRYSTNGSLDTTFDFDGIVLTPIGTSSDRVSALKFQADGKIVAAGYTLLNSYLNFAIARYNYDDALSGIKITANKNSEITIYPNPFAITTNLKTDKVLNNASLVVRNIYGQKVKQLENLSGQSITLDRDNLPNGIYFVQLIQDSKIITTNKVVVAD